MCVCLHAFRFGCLVCATVSGRACGGQLKDEPEACYRCFEKCQTASSSTDSPTVPDIWRRAKERDRGRERGGRKRERPRGGRGRLMKVPLCDVYLEK